MKKSEELKKQYENVCNEYLRKFCNKQGFVFENDMWVNQDIGSIVMCNDMFLNFSDIVWDVNSKQPKGCITDWYYECLENIEKSINYFSYTKGLRKKDVISRLILYAFIWISCYHICNVWLNDDGDMDLLWATIWTGNIAWIKPFWRWMINGL